MNDIRNIKVGDKYKHLPSGQIKTFTKETDIPWEVVNPDNYVIVEEYTIADLKKELKLSNKEIAQFFNMTYGAFANSSAKERYETALCKFYSFFREGEKKKNQDTTDVDTRDEP